MTVIKLFEKGLSRLMINFSESLQIQAMLKVPF